MDNKFPGKDITDSDLKDKFPLSSSLNKKKIIKINNDISFGGDVVPIISGPNGIENKDLIFRCCELLEKNNLKLLRGQIYKPLTFPYRSKKYYEVGDEGLKIGREGLQPIYDFVEDPAAKDKPFFIWHAPFLPTAGMIGRKA